MIQKIMEKTDAEKYLQEIKLKIVDVDLDEICGDEPQKSELEKKLKSKLVQAVQCGLIYYNDDKKLLVQKLIKPIKCGEQTADFLEFYNDLSLNHVKNNKAETPVQALIQTGAILTRRSENLISQLSKTDSTLLEGIISFFDM